MGELPVIMGTTHLNAVQPLTTSIVVSKYWRVFIFSEVI
jgi:hypothetical protein